jgi:NADH-quinone oxidoreductase subunit N
MLVSDRFSTFLQVLFLGSGLAAIPLAYDYLKRMEMMRGEYYTLMMFSISGMMLMAQAYDLIIVFLALELLSIPLYILAGFMRGQLASEEAGLKYFLLGAFAGGFVLYGSALIFASSAHTGLLAIVAAVRSAAVNLPLFGVGAGLLLVGFGFKAAAVPFHMWTPDVYQGSPSPLSGFMSVAVKAAAFTALLRVFLLIFPTLSDSLTPVLWVIAALTMLVGNLLALPQSNIKRMLAYSSIAHAGYMMMAFVGYGQPGMADQVVASTLFYLVAYGLTSFGAWSVVVAVEQAEGKGLEIAEYAGLGRKYPWLGALMLLFMLSFAGVPISMGFWGKFYLFRTAVESGYWSLALIGLLTSLISAYYYLRVVVVMFMKTGEPVVSKNTWVTLTAAVMAAAVLGLSLVPGPLFDLAAKALFLAQ